MHYLDEQKQMEYKELCAYHRHQRELTWQMGSILITASLAVFGIVASRSDILPLIVVILSGVVSIFTLVLFWLIFERMSFLNDIMKARMKEIDPTGLAEDRFCDDSGVCISNGPNGWVSTDAKTGEVITTKQKINDLLAEGKILEAVIEVLKALGYDTSNAVITYSEIFDEDKNMKYIGSVSLLVDGMEVVINVYIGLVP